MRNQFFIVLKRITICFIYILLGFLPASLPLCAQNIVVPEEVKKKCADLPLDERVTLRVARFSKSTSGINSKGIDRSEKLKAQLVATGEITEYNHTSQSTGGFGLKKTTIKAHIGFILQLRNPVTDDILFSKSFNQEGSSDNKSMVINVKTKNGLNIPLSTSSDEPIDKAYFDAFEKGILEAITFMVDNRDKIIAYVKGTGGASAKTTIVISNATFSKLAELENALKTLTGVAKTEKSLKNGEGKVVVLHGGQDIVGFVGEKLAAAFEITGLEVDKILVKAK